MRSRHVGIASFCCVASLWMTGCEVGDSEPCYSNDQPVALDRVVHGALIDDIVGPYFGSYSGTLSYSDGESTEVTLSVPSREGEPCYLANVWQCRAKEVYCHTTTRITTEDGVFAHDNSATLSVDFPDVPSSDSLPILGGFVLGPDQWGEALTERLPLDLTRYEATSLHFELDWRLDEPPRGGEVIFRGTLTGTDLRDEIVVASLAFEHD